MLTSKEAVDGYSKLNVTSDFDKLSRALQAKAIEMDNMLNETWVKLQGESHEPIHKAKASGKLCVRMVLLVLSKQKHGRDLEFESFQEVTEAFAADLLGQAALAPRAWHSSVPSGSGRPPCTRSGGPLDCEYACSTFLNLKSADFKNSGIQIVLYVVAQRFPGSATYQESRRHLLRYQCEFGTESSAAHDFCVSAYDDRTYIGRSMDG